MSFCFKASTGFVRVKEEKNWTDAQKYCREKHTDLASVRNERENNLIKNITEKPNPHKQVWIGLHRLWVWSDNSTDSFTHWKTDRSGTRVGRNDDCALIDLQGRWTDQLCSEPHHFMCYDGEYINHLIC